jgi:archaellum component FlaC
MATKVKEAAGAVERILLPRLNSIDGELKSINTMIDAVHTMIDAVYTRIEGVDTRIEGVDTRIEGVDTRIEGVDTRIDAVHTRIDEMDKRHTIQFESIRNEMRGLAEKMGLVKDMEKLKVEVAELKRRR